MRISLLFGGLLLAIAASGCQVRLISDYDSYTDESVSKLQKSLEKHLTTMERAAVGFDGKPVHPDCDYATNTDFYVEAIATARSLKTRNEVRPKNSITTLQLGLLVENIQLIEELHKGSPPSMDHCLSAEDIALNRLNMDQMFVAILKLEIAKKEGRTKQ